MRAIQGPIWAAVGWRWCGGGLVRRCLLVQTGLLRPGVGGGQAGAAAWCLQAGVRGRPWRALCGAKAGTGTSELRLRDGGVADLGPTRPDLMGRRAVAAARRMRRGVGGRGGRRWSGLGHDAGWRVKSRANALSRLLAGRQLAEAGDGGGFGRRSLLEGIAEVTLWLPVWVCSGEIPRSFVIGRWRHSCVVFPPEGIDLELLRSEGPVEVGWCWRHGLRGDDDNGMRIGVAACPSSPLP